MRGALARRWIVAVTAVVALGTGACSDGDPKLGGPSSDASGNLTGPAVGQALETVGEGKLTACTAVPDAPFALEVEGGLDGIDIELVRAIGGRLGLSPTFVTTDRDSIFEDLDAGRCDIVASSVTITPELRATLGFSAAYFQVNQSLLVRKGDETRYGDLPALAGRKVGVVASTKGATFAKANAQGTAVTEFPGADELLTALGTGKVDAALQDLPVNAYDATTTGETVVVNTFTEADKEEYGLAAKKGNTALIAAVDGALTQVRSDDTYPTILRRFLGDTAGQIQ